MSKVKQSWIFEMNVEIIYKCTDVDMNSAVDQINDKETVYSGASFCAGVKIC